MNLLKGESIISEGEIKYLTLTTHRIRKEVNRYGQVNITSLMIEEITSCEFLKKSKPLFLILSLLLGAVVIILANTESIGSDLEGVIGGLIILSALSLLFYFFSLRKMICISTPTANITVYIRGTNITDVMSFIDKVEEAKNNRLKNIQ